MTNPFPNLQAALRAPIFYPWVAAVVVGSCLSNFIIRLTTPLIFRLFDIMGTNSGTGLSILIALLLGAIAGGCEWFILKRHFRKAYWWIVSIALGYIASLLLTTCVFPAMLKVLSDPSVWGAATWFQRSFASTIIRALSDGLCIGIAQWLFFKRHHIQNAFPWIVVTVISRIFLYLVPQINWTDYVPALSSSPWLLPLITVVSIVRLILLATIVGSLTGVVLAGFIEQLNTGNIEEPLRV